MKKEYKRVSLEITKEVDIITTSSETETERVEIFSNKTAEVFEF
jgi:hypothetical protein